MCFEKAAFFSQLRCVTARLELAACSLNEGDMLVEL